MTQKPVSEKLLLIWVYCIEGIYIYIPSVCVCVCVRFHRKMNKTRRGDKNRFYPVSSLRREIERHATSVDSNIILFVFSNFQNK